ncbi:restriction endonuclease [Mucilaginibacter sp. dw_454]|uniref:restriction endonuclease n=1 Tax=Mucilaginibacter sp. dw_454 TaxID=2720079 RepID=UPI001BD3D36F|nr:restriction endonuclease [Mucilaginibacter sp. dw_454]
MNFKKLSPEDFEFLVEDILKLKGFTITSRPGRGPDQSRDMIAERLYTSDMKISVREVWLVQCKHLAGGKKNRSVLESDIPNFVTKASQHKANRYLLATTTVVSETVKDLFNATNDNERSGLKCAFFNQHDLKDFIRLYPDLYEKYFNSDDQPLKEKARALARFLQVHHFEVHRGAILYDSNITAVFGNDKFSDKRTKQTISAFRQLLKEEGVHEIILVQTDDKFSWCMFIQSSNAYYYHEKIWELYPADDIGKAAQKEANFTRLWTHWDTPFIASGLNL